MLWNETQGITSGKQGVFQIMLGAVNPLSPTVFSDGDRWLEIDIESPVNDPPMAPRQKLVTVAYAFIAEEAARAGFAAQAAHAQSAEYSRRADYAVAAGTASLALEVPDKSVTAAKLADGAVTAAKLADGAVTPSKLADEARYTDEKAVSAARNSGLFIQISTAPGEAVSLILPGASPSIKSVAGSTITIEAPEGAIEINSPVTVDADFRVGRNTVFLDSTMQQIGIGTSSPLRALHIYKNTPSIRFETVNSAYGKYDITQSLDRLNIVRNDTDIFSFGDGGSFRFTSGAYQPTIEALANSLIVKGTPNLHLVAYGNIYLEPGSEAVYLRGRAAISSEGDKGLRIDAGTSGVLLLNTVSNGTTRIGTLFSTTEFGGDLALGNQNRIVSYHYHEPMITVGEPIVLHRNVNVQGDVSISGKFIGNGSGLTNLPTAQMLVTDAVTLSGRPYEHFLTTSSAPQTKSGGLNIMGNLGVGTTAPVSGLHIENPNPAIDLRVSGVRRGLFDTNAEGFARLLTQGPSSKFVFGTGAGPDTAMTIDSNQRVGIGTAYPEAKLDVAGDIKVGGRLKVSGKTDISDLQKKGPNNDFEISISGEGLQENPQQLNIGYEKPGYTTVAVLVQRWKQTGDDRRTKGCGIYNISYNPATGQVFGTVFKDTMYHYYDTITIHYEILYIR